MNQSLTEKFIFVSRNEDEVSKVFSRKIVQFHERFSDCLILAGLGVENESLESMNMEKSPDFDEAYFQDTIVLDVKITLILIFFHKKRDGKFF